jgi:hypothetical protein
MRSVAYRLPFSPVSIAGAVVGALVVGYLGLIAVVMSYAAVTIEFAQSVRNDESQVAALEAQYLEKVSVISNTDYAALGYAKPLAEIYVPTAPVTALR